MKNFAKTTLALSFVAGLSACDPGGGAAGHITTLMGRGDAGGATGGAGRPAGDEGTAGASGGAGAAGADAGAPDAIVIDPTAAFLGTWRYFEGNISLTCDDGSTPSASPDGAITFIAGDAPTQVIEVDDSGCQVPCTVSGDTAVAVSSVNCVDEQMVVTSLTYTLTNGALREQIAGRVVYQGAGCMFTADSMLTHH
jgi:hypothetical protein